MNTPRIPLAALCEFLNGGTPSRDIARYFDGDIPWITGADITSSTVTRARSYITDEAIQNSATNFVQAGTVLLVTRTSVGKVATAGIPLCFSQDITALIPNQSRLNTSYLVAYLRTQESHFDRLARGATIKGITRQVVADLELPLPPLPEQRRIADILDRADALRAKRRAALALLDSLPQAIMREMFASSCSDDWPCLTIADLARPGDSAIRTGPFGSQLLHGEFTDNGVAVLGIDNAVNNEFSWSQRRFISETKYQQLKRYTVLPDDVIITIMGTCGRCAVVPSNIPTSINTKHLCCITLDHEKCLPVFLHAYFLRHPVALKYLAQTAKGAIMEGLNMGLIKSMPVRLPPLPLQQDFARRVESLEQLRSHHRAALATLDELFAALQHRAFRGEL